MKCPENLSEQFKKWELRADSLKEKEQQVPKCRECKGNGFVLYNAKKDGRMYEYMARCPCEKGKMYMFLPTIDEIFIQQTLDI